MTVPKLSDPNDPGAWPTLLLLAVLAAIVIVTVLRAFGIGR